MSAKNDEREPVDVVGSEVADDNNASRRVRVYHDRDKQRSAVRNDFFLSFERQKQVDRKPLWKQRPA